MHEEPLHLIPYESQEAVYAELNRRLDRRDYRIAGTGNLCPFCRKTFQDLLAQYDGNWEKLIRHVVVKRLMLSEKDRVGIGTFQPKDEKNQDSTELTGDLNYRKIAEYGSDSDPRAFNFDGELNIANRGLIEFIEILKLDVAFLYDLLGASQEHKIKPKKFPQTDIDEVMLGPHQRARVPQAPEQRADGGLPRPHGEDRRPLQHRVAGRGEDLRPRLQRAADHGQAHRPPHHRDVGHVGGADPPGGARRRRRSRSSRS